MNFAKQIHKISCFILAHMFVSFSDNACRTMQYENMVVLQNDYKTLFSIDSRQCRRLCENDPSHKCKSAEYNSKLQQCHLSTMTYNQAEKRKLLRTVDDFTMFAVCDKGSIVLHLQILRLLTTID